MITEQEINQRLQLHIADFVNRKFSPRDAVAGALRAVADWASAEGFPAAVQVGEEDFERLVTQVEQMIERFRAEQEKGAVPVGGGVYVDVVDNDEYAERMKRGG